MITSVLLGAICVVSLLTAVSAGDDADNAKKRRKAEETKTKAAIKLFKTGRLVLPVVDAPDLATYLKALAARSGTEVGKIYLSGKEWRKPAPIPAGKAAKPVFKWLAEAINARPINLQIDSKARWCFFLREDPVRCFSYAASGGVICKLHGFIRKKNREQIWAMSRFIFDRDLARKIVATQMEMEVVEAVNANGKKFPAKKPDPNAAPLKPSGINWVTNQQSIWLKKADFPGDKITKLRMRGRIALRTGTTRFLVTTLGHKKPVTISQDGVTVTISPIEAGKRAGSEIWNLPVEVSTRYAEPRGMSSHGESIMFLSEDGKHLTRTSWSATHIKGRHQMTIRIKPHSIDPESTQMVIEHPTGLKILPVDLTFKNIQIRDVQERPEK
ncbi:MAG: hypothetical protein QGG42_05955 [Phycisphaerae bacterium]|nr:hypothetical protein [Phycisphaerae bacterium]